MNQAARQPEVTGQSLNPDRMYCRVTVSHTSNIPKYNDVGLYMNLEPLGTQVLDALPDEVLIEALSGRNA